MKLLRKFGRLVAFSILSLVAYCFIHNSEKINTGLQMILESSSYRAIGIYILLVILKYFLLLFGVLGLLMFGYRVIKKYYLPKTMF
ncbi:hypothetical protein [Polaribacter sp. R77954]|uniref:hypothetical protein n=1 Tax=Polaribacter sp. R77954 TaxID=3093870 RepID=UPI0037C9EA43